MGLFDKIKDVFDGDDDKKTTDTPVETTTETTADATFDPNMDAVPSDTGIPDATFDPNMSVAPETPVETPAAEAPATEIAEPAIAEPAPEAPAAEPVVEAAPAPQAQTYEVESGDNLTFIAERFGTSVDALVEANGIENPDLIYPGQILTIPA